MDSRDGDVCRVCLYGNERDPASEIGDETLWYKLFACTSVKVRPRDPMTKSVCSTCVGRIDDAYDLRERARSSDAALKRKCAAVKVGKSTSRRVDRPNCIESQNVSESLRVDIEEFDAKKNEIAEATSSERNCDDAENSTKNFDDVDDLEKLPRVKFKSAKSDEKRKKKNNTERLETKIVDGSTETEISKGDVNFHSPTRLDRGKSSKRDKDKTEATYECEKCPDVFDRRYAYDRHLKIAHDLNGRGRVKRYMCDVCGNIFHDKYGLLMHMRRHSGDKPFTCDICGQEFSQSINMRRHVSAKHHKVKSFQCELCPKRFAYSSTLREHARNHSGELLHSCDVCDRRFSRRFSLVRHRLTHTRARPFSCVHCAKAYTQTNDLKAHVKRAHPGVAAEKLSDYCTKEPKNN